MVVQKEIRQWILKMIWMLINREWLINTEDGAEKTLFAVELQKKYYEKDEKQKKWKEDQNVAAVDVELVVSADVSALVAKILENQKEKVEEIVNTNVVVLALIQTVLTVLYQVNQLQSLVFQTQIQLVQ